MPPDKQWDTPNFNEKQQYIYKFKNEREGEKLKFRIQNFKLRSFLIDFTPQPLLLHICMIVVNVKVNSEFL